jgi:hypothetical protein
MLNASFYGFFFSLDCDIAAFLKFGCFSDFLRNYYSAFFINFNSGTAHWCSHKKIPCPTDTRFPTNFGLDVHSALDRHSQISV